jgi:hypothetical protein
VPKSSPVTCWNGLLPKDAVYVPGGTGSSPRRFQVGVMPGWYGRLTRPGTGVPS